MDLLQIFAVIEEINLYYLEVLQEISGQLSLLPNCLKIEGIFVNHQNQLQF